MALLFFNITFNYAFSNFGIGFIPFNQLFTVFFFFALLIFKKKQSFNILFYIILVLFGSYLVKLPYCIYKYGIFAMRDGTHYLDMLFLMYSFFIVKESNLKKEDILKHLYNILQICWVYYFLMSIEPVKNLMVSVSPRVNGIQRSLPLFGFTTYCAVWAVVLFFWDMWKISNNELNKHKKIVVVIRSFLTLFLCFSGNGRSAIIGFLVILSLLLFKNKKIRRHITPVMFFVIIFVLIFFITGITINLNGRTLSANHLLNLALSIGGEGDYSGKAAGTEKRFEWWYNIWKYNTSEITCFLFGRGFGMPLTDFYVTSTTIVREPHNSFVSVFARQGVLGLILWCFLLLKIFDKSIRKFNRDISDYLIITVCIAFLTVALVEAVFEVSYAAIPIYSLIGICLALKSDYNHTDRRS